MSSEEPADPHHRGEGGCGGDQSGRADGGDGSGEPSGRAGGGPGAPAPAEPPASPPPARGGRSPYAAAPVPATVPQMIGCSPSGIGTASSPAKTLTGSRYAIRLRLQSPHDAM